MKEREREKERWRDGRGIDREKREGRMGSKRNWSEKAEQVEV